MEMKKGGSRDEKEHCLARARFKERFLRRAPVVLRARKSFLRKAVLCCAVRPRQQSVCGQSDHSKCKPVYSRIHTSGEADRPHHQQHGHREMCDPNKIKPSSRGGLQRTVLRESLKHASQEECRGEVRCFAAFCEASGCPAKLKETTPGAFQPRRLGTGQCVRLH